MVTLVDTFGGTMIIFILGVFELIVIFWVYGEIKNEQTECRCATQVLKNIPSFIAGIEDFCLDLEFTTGRKASFYWRFCWIFLSPASMILVLLYSFATMKPITYSGLDFPIEYVVGGWTILAVGLVQLPIWFIYAFAHNTKTTSVCDALYETFKPNKHWGPRSPQTRVEWLKFKEEAKQRHRLAARKANHSTWTQKLYIAFGKY